MTMTLTNLGIICIVFLILIILFVLYLIYLTIKELNNIRRINENSVIHINPISNDRNFNKN